MNQTQTNPAALPTGGFKYHHRVQYYETDRMGITHHSNYVRWMEEARIAFLEKLGWNYAHLEETGIFSPVVSVECHYRAPSAFPDLIAITVTVERLTAARLTLQYTMANEAGKTVCTARSEHCFTDASGRILRLSRACPALYKLLAAQIPPEGQTPKPL